MKKSVVLLVVLGMMLAACGPAMVPAAAPKTETGEVFAIALPRIVITLDESGKPGIEGIPIEDIAKLAGYPLDLSAYRIDPFYVSWMKSAGVQHVEIRQTGQGLAVLVNGTPMPHVSWSDASLRELSNLAPLFMLREDMVKKFAPILSRIGMSVAVKFPKAADAPDIPFASEEVAMQAAQPANVPPSALVQFEVKYDANGVPSIMGISAQDLVAMGINVPLALHPYYIALMQANNIQYMELRSKSDGITVYINGVPLPGIVWDQKMISSAVDVYAQMNPGVPKDYLTLIRQFAPMLGAADMQVLVHFPRAAGVQPIPVTRH